MRLPIGGAEGCVWGGGDIPLSDHYLQECCAELGPDPSQPLRPKMSHFYKQVLSLLRDEAWMRDTGRL